VPTEPVIESSHNLKVGPWSITYPELAEQQAAAKLNPSDENKFEQIYDFTPEETPGPHWVLVPSVGTMDLAAVLNKGPESGTSTKTDASTEEELEPSDTGSPFATVSKPQSEPEPREQEREQGQKPQQGQEAQDEEAEGRYWKVVYNVVSVRVRPESGADEVGERLKEEVVEVAEVKGDWVRLQAPPGYKGDERWMLTQSGETTLLKPLPMDQVPMHARMASPRARKAVAEASGGSAAEGKPAGGGGIPLKFCVAAAALLGLALIVILEFALDGRVRLYSPAPHFSLAEMPDLQGKYALVTGSTSGIGMEIAVALASKGAHLYVGARSEEQGRANVAAIEAASGGKAEYAGVLDLASLQSARSFADGLATKEGGLHILVLNAGVMAPPFATTADGYESQFGINHLGHFALVTVRALPGRLSALSA
jgi:hypothetical protein